MGRILKIKMTHPYQKNTPIHTHPPIECHLLQIIREISTDVIIFHSHYISFFVFFFLDWLHVISEENKNNWFCNHAG